MVLRVRRILWVLSLVVASVAVVKLQWAVTEDRVGWPWWGWSQEGAGSSPGGRGAAPRPGRELGPREGAPGSQEGAPLSSLPCCSPGRGQLGVLPLLPRAPCRSPSVRQHLAPGHPEGGKCLGVEVEGAGRRALSPGQGGRSAPGTPGVPGSGALQSCWDLGQRRLLF